MYVCVCVCVCARVCVRVFQDNDSKHVEEKKEAGLFFNTVRYPPTWRWKDESADDTDTIEEANTSNRSKPQQSQQQQRWTSRGVLVEQLQKWLPPHSHVPGPAVLIRSCRIAISSLPFEHWTPLVAVVGLLAGGLLAGFWLAVVQT